MLSSDRFYLRRCAAADGRVIDEQHDDRSDDSDDHAVDVEPRDRGSAEGGKQKTADKRSNDPEHDIA